VLDKGLYVLMSIGSEFQVAALTGGEYYNFLLSLIVIFGVSFELPLIIVMLNLVGILRYEHVKDKRRLIIVLIFVFAAIMTPGQDPFSMVALALSITVLVEMAFQFCRWNDRKRNRERPDWMDLSDDEASGPIEAPTPIGKASRVSVQPEARPAPKQPARSARTRPPNGATRTGRISATYSRGHAFPRTWYFLPAGIRRRQAVCPRRFPAPSLPGGGAGPRGARVRAHRLGQDHRR